MHVNELASGDVHPSDPPPTGEVTATDELKERALKRATPIESTEYCEEHGMRLQPADEGRCPLCSPSPEGEPSVNGANNTLSLNGAPIAPRDIITADDGTRFEVVSVTEEVESNSVIVKASPVDLHRNLAFKATVPMGIWNDVSTEADEDMLRQDVADTLAEQYGGRPLA